MLTGMSSPRPTIILAVTRRTKSGAVSGTIKGKSRSLLTAAGASTW